MQISICSNLFPLLRLISPKIAAFFNSFLIEISFPGPLNNKDNKNNPSPEFKPVISNPHVRVFQNGSLAISSVARADGANYLCQVTNGIGSGLSKVISLTVNGNQKQNN